MDPEDLTRLQTLVALEGDVGRLVEDEHSRYALYTAALAASASSELEEDVLRIVRKDADFSMSQAAVVAHIDRMGERLDDVAAYRDWLARRRGMFADLEFATHRADEWTLFKEIAAGAGAADRLTDATDWLQRKVADEANDKTALEQLSANGRTRRVRGTAASRLAQLRKANRTA